MASPNAKTLLHPVRMRIVLALGGDALTTTALAAALPDVAQATLYRHVKALDEAGIIEVVGERQARGAVERTYRLVEGEANVGEEDARAMSLDDHRDGFAAFAGALVSQFGAYLDSEGARPGADPLGYRQTVLNLGPDDVSAMFRELYEVIERYEAREPADGRRKFRLSYIFAPDGAAPAE